MNILKKAALWAGLKAVGYSGVGANLTEPGPWRSWLGGRSNSGKAITEDSAMQITTAFACVRLLAETIGGVTLNIYERQANGNAERVEHPLTDVLVNKPNTDMTGLEYREAKGTNLVARGNAYSIIERRSDGNVLALYPVPSAQAQCKRLDNGDIVYKFNLNGRWEEYPADKVWHWKGFGFNGLVGLSPIACAREAMGLALAGEEFNARLFANGLMPSATISIPEWLKPDQRAEANKKLLEMHAGLVNMGKPMLLEGGMKVEQGLFTPEDAQFLQLRKMQIPEICRVFRISPHMVAELERATNNNIEQLSLEFVMYTMLPYFRRIEERVQQLLVPADRGRFFARFNAESLLRGDSVARAQLYSILLQNGVFTRNEVRALENRNRVTDDGMDGYTVQSNMAPIDQLAELVAAQKKPPSVPVPQKAGDTIIVNQHPAPASAPEPQKPGDVKVEGSHFDVHLPESMSHDIKHQLDAPAIVELAEQTRRLAERVLKQNEDAERRHAETAEQIKAASYRIAIFNDQGEPIGSRPAQPHELH